MKLPSTKDIENADIPKLQKTKEILTECKAIQHSMYRDVIAYLQKIQKDWQETDATIREINKAINHKMKFASLQGGDHLYEFFNDK